MRHGTATTDDVIQLAGPQDKANFLFGDDVNDYLIRLRKDLAHLGYCRTIIAQLKGDEQYHKAVEAQHKIMVETVGKFHEEFGALLRPYMKMHHKKPLW